MNKLATNTVLHTNLITLSNSSEGFAVSEVSGYSPEQVRRSAEALVAAGQMVRAKLSARRVRYFANDKLANAYATSRPTTSRSQSSGGPRSKAPWRPEDPPIITSKTKIYIAPPPPSDVFCTNTYLKF